MREINFERSHALEAIDRAKEHGIQWLYENYPKYGGQKRVATTGFLLHDGQTYPVKPLGRLACEIAGNPLVSNPITNLFRRQFERLGFRLIENTEQEAVDADTRQRRLAETWVRPKQAEFRRGVFSLFGSACIVSGCETLEVVEAAHIIPLPNGGTNDPWNGFPLRADLHRLFDADLLQIDPETWHVIIVGAAAQDYPEYRKVNIAAGMEEIADIENVRQALLKRKRIRNT